MAVQLQLSVRILHGDGAVMAHTERAVTVMNPQPRDIINDADLGQEQLDTMLEEMKVEARAQIDNWKAATINLLGGSTGGS